MHHPDFGIILGLDFLAKIIYMVYGICFVFVYIDFGKIGIFAIKIIGIPVTIIYRNYNNQVLIHLIK
jgi:hypothetical protein